MAERTTADNIPVYDCSMWKAFDEVQLCYMAAAQARHYYRHGSFRDCSVAREKFMFCAGLAMKPKDVQEKMLDDKAREHYFNKIINRPSATVWKLRTEPPRDFPPKLAE